MRRSISNSINDASDCYRINIAAAAKFRIKRINLCEFVPVTFDNNSNILLVPWSDGPLKNIATVEKRFQFGDFNFRYFIAVVSLNLDEINACTRWNNKRSSYNILGRAFASNGDIDRDRDNWLKPIQTTENKITVSLQTFICNPSASFDPHYIPLALHDNYLPGSRVSLFLSGFGERVSIARAGMYFPPLERTDYRADYGNDDKSYSEISETNGSPMETYRRIGHSALVKSVLAFVLFVVGYASLQYAGIMSFEGRDTVRDRWIIGGFFAIAVCTIGSSILLVAYTF